MCEERGIMELIVHLYNLGMSLPNLLPFLYLLFKSKSKSSPRRNTAHVLKDQDIIACREKKSESVLHMGYDSMKLST
jgi:hypothetical protein